MHPTQSSGIKGDISSPFGQQASGQSGTAYEIFAYMMVEEFLMKKGMISSLQAFRQEWSRPDEFTSTVSWYDIALKLHLQDIHNTDKVRNCTVLDNVVHQVVKDASVRSRRETDVIVTGLATLPRSLSTVSFDTIANANTFLGIPNNTNNSNNSNNVSNTNALPISPSGANIIEKDNAEKDKSYKLAKIENKKENAFKNQDNKEKKVSAENWVPEITRMRSIQRDLETLKENFNDMRVREITQEKELKRFAVTDLQRARVEESLGSTKKIPCACCLQKFLYVNLPLKVSQKAIVDIRIKWSGLLNSKTIFEGVSAISNEDPDESSDNLGLKESKKKRTPKSDDRINAIPRCYDEVLVCNFCAQFFHDQAEYRPSFDLIVQNEKKTIFLEHKKKELEYWDPLKMVTKDRELKEKNWSQKDEEEEALLQTMLGTSLQAAARENISMFHNPSHNENRLTLSNVVNISLAAAAMKQKHSHQGGEEGKNNTIDED